MSRLVLFNQNPQSIDERGDPCYAERMERCETGPAVCTRTQLPSGGMLYIWKKGARQTVCPPGRDAVLVFDDRHTGNPSFQIVESCRIKNNSRKREILQAIIDFDARTPTDPPWRRTMDSLVKEWNLHNLAFRLHVCRRSSRDVDLDNRDEGKGYLHFFAVAAQRAAEKLRGLFLHRSR